MADGQVTGGIVRLLERVKTGDYEHKEAMVELHFSVYDGQDYRDLIDRVKAETVTQVHQILGRTKDTLAAAKREARRPPKIEVEVTGENVTVEEALSVAQTKPDLPANKTVVTTNDPTVPPSTGAGSTPDPLDMSDPGGEIDHGLKSGTSPTGGSTPDPLDMDEELAAAAPEVTDKLLNEQVQFHNNRLITAAQKKDGGDGAAGTLKLRELIGKFVPVGKKVRDIPADQRQNFLDGLKALTV